MGCRIGTEFSGFFAAQKATELRPYLALNFSLQRNHLYDILNPLR